MENENDYLLLIAVPVAYAICWGVDRAWFRRAASSLEPARWTEGQALLVVVFWLFSQIVCASFIAVLGFDTSSPTALFAVISTVAVLVGVVAILLLRLTQGSRVALGWLIGPGRNYLVLPLLCAAVIVLLQPPAMLWRHFLEDIGADISEQQLVEQFRLWIEQGAHREILFFLINGVVLAPLTEELVFRGILFSALEARRGFWVAAVVSSAIFGFVHWAPIALVPVTILGIFLCYLLHRTGSLLVSIVFHALFNAANLGIVWLEVQRTLESAP